MLYRAVPWKILGHGLDLVVGAGSLRQVRGRHGLAGTLLWKQGSLLVLQRYLCLYRLSRAHLFHGSCSLASLLFLAEGRRIVMKACVSSIQVHYTAVNHVIIRLFGVDHVTLTNVFVFAKKLTSHVQVPRACGVLVLAQSDSV